jgi:hypothetical protein
VFSALAIAFGEVTTHSIPLLSEIVQPSESVNCFESPAKP